MYVLPRMAYAQTSSILRFRTVVVCFGMAELMSETGLPKGPLASVNIYTQDSGAAGLSSSFILNYWRSIYSRNFILDPQPSWIIWLQWVYWIKLSKSFLKLGLSLGMYQKLYIVLNLTSGQQKLTSYEIIWFITCII